VAGGQARARPHCRFAPLIHFTPDSRTYSAPFFLKRQCDRTLGQAARAGAGNAPASSAWRQRTPPVTAAQDSQGGGRPAVGGRGGGGAGGAGAGRAKDPEPAGATDTGTGTGAGAARWRRSGRSTSRPIAPKLLLPQPRVGRGRRPAGVRRRRAARRPPHGIGGVPPARAARDTPSQRKARLSKNKLCVNCVKTNQICFRTQILGNNWYAVKLIHAKPVSFGFDDARTPTKFSTVASYYSCSRRCVQPYT
jgi:hypothetical protein